MPFSDPAKILLALGALAFAWLSIRKVLHPFWKWVRRVSRSVGGALDTLAGRPAIIERATGKELSPEVPALGVVLDGMKTELARVADVSTRLDRVDIIIDSHDKAIAALIAGSAERAATALSSAALLNAVANSDTVNGDPDTILHEIESQP